MSFDTEFLFTEKELASSLPATEVPFYMVESGLRNAVRVAMLLKQPLLLTGKPGTGKTQLAYKLANDLNRQFPHFLSKPLVFHTKTVSTYTDLLYTYDALGHFHAAHFDQQNQQLNVRNQPLDVRQFIQLEALGQAILLSNPAFELPYQLMPEARFLLETDKRNAYSSVVLIDEVDKAPRDFPNDLLNELDRFEFKVREDKNTLYKKGDGQILVILTSNSEKNLPDAFLRRCIFYHIEFPDNNLLTALLIGRLFSDLKGKEKKKVESTLDQYIIEFEKIRGISLRKQPSTAELISWIFFLRSSVVAGKLLQMVDIETRNASFSSLAKQEEDLTAIKAMYP